MLMMMVWSVGDSGTALGDISPAPFCPITRLLCGHRAPILRASIRAPQYSLLTNVLLCVAGVLVKYEEKARQKVAWVVLACPWVLPGLTCSYTPSYLGYTPSYLPVGVLRSLVTLLMTMAMTNMSGHGSGWS